MRIAPSHPATTRFFLIGLLAILPACGSNSTTTPPPQGAIALALSPTSATVQQGGSTQVTGTLTRSGGFTGDVSVELVNPPAGVTAALTTHPVNGGSTAQATLSVASTVAAGSYVLQVQASGSGVTSVTATFNLTVTVAPSFTIVGTPATVTLPQSMTASTGIRVSRSGGLTGTIGFTSTGAPAGLAVAFAPTSVTDSFSVTVTAGAAVPVGAYPIVVTGTSGTATAQTTITVTVTGTAALDFSACASFAKPIWVGSQDGNGNWIHLAGSGDVYRIPVFASGTGAVAVVTQGTGGSTVFYTTTVRYIAQGELATFGTCTTAVPGKTVHGSIAGVTGTDAVEIAMGGGTTAFANALVPSFQLPNVPAGPQDLTAFKVAAAGPAGYRIILRRDQNFADGATMPVLDFGSSEAFAPVTALLTVNGGAMGGYFATGRYLVGPNCLADTMNFTPVAFPSPLTVYGVPAAQQRPTDFHNVVLQQINTAADMRTLTQSIHALVNSTVSVGAGIGPLTTATLPGSYRRFQVMFTLASDYTSASLTYSSSGSLAIGIFNVMQSPAYLGGATAISLTPPDLSTVDGYQTVWAPNATGTLTYTVGASSTPPPTLCAEGALIRTASSSVGAS